MSSRWGNSRNHWVIEDVEKMGIERKNTTISCCFRRDINGPHKEKKKEKKNIEDLIKKKKKVSGAFNKVPHFFVQAFKIVVDS